MCSIKISTSRMKFKQSVKQSSPNQSTPFNQYQHIVSTILQNAAIAILTNKMLRPKFDEESWINESTHLWLSFAFIRALKATCHCNQQFTNKTQWLKYEIEDVLLIIN